MGPDKVQEDMLTLPSADVLVAVISFGTQAGTEMVFSKGHVRDSFCWYQGIGKH